MFIEITRRAQLIACASETIATRAGISTSVIASSFSSTEELIEQVGKAICTDAAHVIGPQIGAHPTARRRLHTSI